nr:hypothetical protein [Bacillus cereus]
MFKKGLLSTVCVTAMASLLTFSPLVTSAKTDTTQVKTASKHEHSVQKGEITLKYTAPDVDLSTVTPEQKETLEKIGWKVENGILVQYRSIPEEVKKAIDLGYLEPLEEVNHQKHNAPTTFSNHEDHTGHEEIEEVLIVNGEKVEIKDGRFDVKGNPDTLEVQIDKDTKQTVQKSEDGKYHLVLEQNLSEVIEKMDNHEGHDNMTHADQSLLNPFSDVTYGYGDTYRNGDWVHCNRFNGPLSDNRHLRKTNPQAIINFYMSDCDLGALRYCLNHANCNQKYRAAYCSWKLGHSEKYHKH